MKTLKITLAIAAISTIGFFLIKWIVNIDTAANAKPPKNQYTDEIQVNIDSIEKLPVNAFCVERFTEIQSEINQYYSNGLLGITPYQENGIWKDRKDDNHNDQWNNILSKNLYTAYTNKFIDQAMLVFNNIEWKVDDIKIIKLESTRLRGSSYLESNSPYAKSLNNINDILAKYDEINLFISNCNGSVPNNFVLNNNFPDLSDKINRSRNYISNKLDNKYVNNCLRLKIGLEDIPLKLFDEHFRYLWKKTNDNAWKYRSYSTQADYASNISTPLRNQIDAIDNDIYKIDDAVFNNRYYRLDTLLNGYNNRSFDHYFK
jgi:hypothetical protein